MAIRGSPLTDHFYITKYYFFLSTLQLHDRLRKLQNPHRLTMYSNAEKAQTVMLLRNTQCKVRGKTFLLNIYTGSNVEIIGCVLKVSEWSIIL